MLINEFKKMPKAVTQTNAVIALGLFFIASSTSWAGELSGKGQSARQARNTEIAKVHAATKQYKDVMAALDAGYLSSVDFGGGCVSAVDEGEPAQLGGMGIHFIQPQSFGLPPNNFTKPNVLVYLPDLNVEGCTYTTGELMENPTCRDSLSLAAVEGLVFAHEIEGQYGGDHWDNVPEFSGRQFYYRHDNPATTWVDEAHGLPPHYELHIWLFEHNPSGLFSPWNPNVNCPSSLHGH